MKSHCGAVLILLAVWAGGCPYRMCARLPVVFEHLYVAPFENRASEPWLGQEITRRVKTAVLTRTGGRIAARPEDADRLRGVLLGVGRDIISEDSVGLSLSERLTVEVSIEFESREGESREFRIIGAAVYERNSAGDRDRLLREALQDAAEQIVNRLIQRGKPEDVRQ